VDWKQDQAALLARFDTDHDGVISAAEWDRARAAAREQVVAAAGARAEAPGINVLSQTGGLTGLYAWPRPTSKPWRVAFAAGLL